MQYCKCHNTLTIKQGLLGLKDEVVEFIHTPTSDEGSDVAYCINRIAGTLLRKPYVQLLPFDKQHKAKIAERMKKYGCIRSERHLILGGCPTEYKEQHPK